MSTSSEKLDILIVEDNAGDAYILEHMLRSSQLAINDIYLTTRVSEACQALKDHPINLVLLDLSLPDSTGINTFLTINELTGSIPVIILTGLADTIVASEAIKRNAQDYLIKGEYNNNQLLKSIEYSIERIRAKARLVESEGNYRQMFNNNPFPACVYDQHTLQILEVNNAAIKKYRYERSSFLQLTLHDIWSVKDPSKETTFLETPTILNLMEKKFWFHKKKTGEQVIVQGVCYPIRYLGKDAMQMQVNDVTNDLRLKREITLTRQRIIDTISTTRLKERKLLGEELHDNISQILGTVTVYLNLALNEVDKSTECIKKGLANTIHAVKEIRKLSKLLVSGLESKSLLQAIQELVESIILISEIKFSLDLSGLHETHLSEDKKVTVFRIIQELLNNILRHSGATNVCINIKTVKTMVLIEVSDDGLGFDTDTLRKGIGITNILSRVDSYGGEFGISTSPGMGCKFTATLNEKIESAVTA